MPIPLPSNRRFGIEIEHLGHRAQEIAALTEQGLVAVDGYSYYERRDDPDYRPWMVKGDGSIHPTSGFSGIELASPPMQGPDGISQLAKACRAMRASGARVNSSCGLHVHVEARDLTAQDVIRLIVGYTQAQTAINSFMPPSRRNSRWAATYPHNIGDRLAGCTTLDAIQRQLENARYRTVNVTAYPVHGTIEFRQHSASTRFSKIAPWVRFVMASVETAVAGRSFGEQLEALLENLSLGASDRAYYIARAARQLSRANRRNRTRTRPLAA